MRAQSIRSGQGSGAGRARASRMPRLGFKIFFVVLAAILLGGSAYAEAALSITPGDISLAPGVPERMVVTLTGGLSDLRGARLTIVAPPGLSTGGSVPMPTAAGTKGWIITLRSDTSLIPTTAVVLVRTRRKVYSQALKIAPAASPPATAQFTAELTYDGEGLFDKAHGDLQLRLTNLSDSRLSLVSILHLPGFLKVDCQPEKICPQSRTVTLAPRDTTIISYRIGVETSEQYPLTTGKHELAATVSATRLEGQRPWQGSQIVTHELTVGIPGLEGVQTLIQVPSFLLLPGFLICVVAMMTWRWRRPPAPEAGKPAAWTTVAISPPLWVLAISLSMAVVWLYPIVSSRLGAGHRNLLQGFDLSDVIRVWVGSILSGFILACFALGGLWCRKIYRDRNNFGAKDKPEVALRKMKRQGLQTLSFQMRNETDTGRLFRVGGLMDDGKVWALPAIRYSAGQGFDEAAFVAAIRANKVGEIVEMVDRAVKGGTLSVRWDNVPNGSGPRIVDASIFSNPHQAGVLFDAE